MQRTIGLGRTWWLDSAGASRPLPDGWAREGLAGILGRYAPLFDGAGTIVVQGAACEALGLPTARVPNGGLPDHPAVGELAAAGWTTRTIGDWSTIKAEGQPTVHLVCEPALDMTRDKEGHVRVSPWWSKWDGDRVAALALWHQHTGTPWHATPAWAGMDVMRARAPQRGGKAIPPVWRPGDNVRPDPEAQEVAYEPRQWGHRTNGRQWVHGYDANRAYVAAAMLARVCPWTLKKTGRTAWQPTLAGWWKVELPHTDGVLAWNDPRLPHPAGYLEGAGPVRWLTGPTMQLLHQLTEAGRFGGVEILDSYTGPARDYPLKVWAETMRDAYAAGVALADDDAPVSAALQRMAKSAGRAALGVLADADGTGWAYRPDWWYTVVALARSNQWRKMDASVAAGAVPVRVNVDCVYYASDTEDPLEALPAGYWRDGKPLWDPTGATLGRFKPHGSRRVAQQPVTV